MKGRWTLALLPVLQIMTTPLQAAPIRFEEALDRIVSRGLTIRRAEENLEIARAGTRPARMHWFPTLQADASANTDQVAKAQLTADMSVFRFGADQDRLHAAQAAEEGSVQALLLARLAEETGAVDALVDVVLRRRGTEILVKTVDGRRRSLKVAQDRFSKGQVSREEADTVAVDLSNTLARSVDVQSQLQDAEARLETLLGTTEVETAWPWRKEFLNPGSPHRALADLPFKLEELPAWRQASANLQSAEARVSEAIKGHFPAFGAQGVYGYGAHLETSGSGGTYWSGALTLTLPLFDGLATSSRAAVRSAEARRAEADLEQVRREAPAEHGAAAAAFRLALQSAIERENTVATARRIRDAGFRRFQMGRQDVNAMTLDEGRLLDAESLAEEGWASLHRVSVRLCHALGLATASCPRAGH